MAIARKLGLPIGILLPYVNSTVLANENSYRTDPYGNGVASEIGVSEDVKTMFVASTTVSFLK